MANLVNIAGFAGMEPYKSVFTSEDYSDRVNLLTKTVNEMLGRTDNKNFYNYFKQKFSSDLAVAKTKHEALFKLFSRASGGTITNLESLQAQLEDYRSNPLPFSGSAVWAFIDKSAAIIANPQVQKDTDTFFFSVIKNKFKNQIKKSNKLISNELHKDVMNILSSGKSHFSSYQGYFSGGKGKDSDTILFDQNIAEWIADTSVEKFRDLINSSEVENQENIMLQEFLSILREYVHYEKMTKPQQDALLNMLKFDTNTSYAQNASNIENHNIKVEWTALIQKNGKILKGSDFKEKGEKKVSANKRQDLWERNQKLTDYLLGLCSNEEQKLYLQAVLSVMLSVNPTMFFTGQADTKIIGNFGEIEAMYHLARIFIPVNKISPGAIRNLLFWKGSTKGSGELKGAEPHQDIILKDILSGEGFGVQVKNSAKDLLKIDDFYDISFQNSTLDHFLGKLNISEATKAVFKNYFYMSAFNVPYRKEGISYVNTDLFDESLNSENGQKFRDNYILLHSEELLKDIDQLLSAFGAIFLYMDVEQNTDRSISEMDMNTLYLIGGVIPKTAWSILKTIEEQFLGNMSDGYPIYITSHLKGQVKDNIVSVMNKQVTQIKGAGNSSISRTSTTEEFKAEVNLTAYYRANYFKLKI